MTFLDYDKFMRAMGDVTIYAANYTVTENIFYYKEIEEKDIAVMTMTVRCKEI